MSRPYIEHIISFVPAYSEYKRDLGGCFAAHRQRRHDVLVRAAITAITLEELRQVVLKHLDPQVLKVPRG